MLQGFRREGITVEKMEPLKEMSKIAHDVSVMMNKKVDAVKRLVENAEEMTKSALWIPNINVSSLSSLYIIVHCCDICLSLTDSATTLFHLWQCVICFFGCLGHLLQCKVTGEQSQSYRICPDGVHQGSAIPERGGEPHLQQCPCAHQYF